MTRSDLPSRSWQDLLDHCPQTLSASSDPHSPDTLCTPREDVTDAKLPLHPSRFMPWILALERAEMEPTAGRLVTQSERVDPISDIVSALDISGPEDILEQPPSHSQLSIGESRLCDEGGKRQKMKWRHATEVEPCERLKNCKQVVQAHTEPSQRSQREDHRDSTVRSHFPPTGSHVGVCLGSDGDQEETWVRAKSARREASTGPHSASGRSNEDSCENVASQTKPSGSTRKRRRHKQRRARGSQQAPQHIEPDLGTTSGRSE